MSTRYIFSLLAILGAIFLILLSIPTGQSAQAMLSATATPRPTRTPTSTPCAVVPSMPTLLGPSDHFTSNQDAVTLNWTSATCAKRYHVVVRRYSPSGRIVKSRYLRTTSFTRSYGENLWFVWSVGACDTIGCTYSDFQSFRVIPVPPPQPSPTPTQPGAPPPPVVTPLPLANIVNYKGPDVYLNNSPSSLYYADCRSKWWQTGGTIYFGVVGFKPGESVNVSYLIFNIQGTTYYTTLTADGNGNLQMAWNSAGATNGHYHWTFASGSASYCGHFDLVQ